MAIIIAILQKKETFNVELALLNSSMNMDTCVFVMLVAQNFTVYRDCHQTTKRKIKTDWHEGKKMKKNVLRVGL